ncbi:MAG: UDP-N-acetylmuramoyl-L-alanyl-D-glutamate--2,6-diaminopimelate ligase [Anaerolineae bacterium]|nr:UDP-N-acetylmuramoyl-L-alanyl-D-glutamate--2,6-diaminopimelate ligase [Anaerolineae bacterium]
MPEQTRALGALIDALPEAAVHNWRPVAIRGIQSDSRRVSAGDLFVAIPGVAVDGHRFVPAALQAGAVACVVERALPELAHVPHAIVPDAREALAYLHAAWHDYPALALRVIGVTGTDGKTTTVRLIRSMLRAAGYAVGAIDTVAATIGDEESPTGFHTTTPDAPEVQAYLANMVSQGMEYAVIEATSHGLAQHRVAACAFDVAVVTNITHEHLDYHGSYEAYREAKARLFHALDSSPRKGGVSKVAVLNADDSSYEYLHIIPADLQLTYGLAASAHLTASQIEATPGGLRLLVHSPAGDIPIRSPLVGRYNVYNILAACAVAHSQSLSAEAIRRGVAEVHGVLGRMERIAQGQPFTAIVDFAHTPNALSNALQAMRDMARAQPVEGQVIVVFGCAGLRDRAKRPWMGRVAGELADKIVITAEDPRTESLDAIMGEIAEGCRAAGRQEGAHFWRVADRAEAIAYALRIAQPGDLVMVTGKGHERSMCFGTTEYPWSDQDAVRDALRDLGYPPDA